VLSSSRILPDQVFRLFLKPFLLFIVPVLLGTLVVFPPALGGLPKTIPAEKPLSAYQDTGNARFQMPVFGQDTAAARAMRDSLFRMRADSTRLDSMRQDSTRRDSLARRRLIKDTTYVICLDSSARLKYFDYQRYDPPSVNYFPRRTYPLFATPRKTSLRRVMSIDSTGTYVEVRDVLGTEDIRIPVRMPLRDYVNARLSYDRRQMLADEARKPPQASTKDDLGQLLSNITQITIPVPPNPLFSIFGKDQITLNISGAVDIKAGLRNTKSDQTTISRLDQSRSEPDFSQEVQVNVSGTIGDKLNILADWNTRRTFEYENQLKIKYTGYEDEIVRSVEAGNVSLQTPSAFVGSSQALFGIKAQFQVGPLTLTGIASQKKGQIKEVAVSGGSKEQTFEFRAFEYATNNFFVDTVYRSTYEPYYQNEPPEVNPDVQIVEEEVWVQRQGGIPDPNERQGIAYITLPARGNGYNEALRTSIDVPGRIEVAPFVKLDRSQYELSGDGYIGVVSLNANVGDQLVVAVAYRRANGSQFGELVRDIGTDSVALSKPLILKMVKPKNLVSNGPSYPVAWNQLLKNIYPIPGIGRNLKKEGFSLDILRRVPGREDVNNILNEPLIRALGVDKFTADGSPAPDGDGQFDFRPGRSIDLARAEIIFPALRPFDTDLARYFAGKGTTLSDTSEYRYQEVYDTTQTFAQQSIRNRYIIRGKAAGEATSRYSLGFNVVEGSVQVILDGRQLVANIDYTVDYIIGEVVIKNDRALIPGANLQIKYEQNDLFQLASKTLLGARGDIVVSQNTALGFTIMNLNQETLSDKVRLGEEPSKNSIFGVDGSTTLNLPFLTRALDALPLLQTREMSSIKVSGEAAYMSPDPNTRKSPIASDNGEAIAYIDDFEGARRFIPIGIAYNAWTQAGVPSDYWFPATPDTTRMFSKGRMVWFNRLPTDVAITDIYPQKKVGNQQNNQATVLDFRYFPRQRGQFNYSRDLQNTLAPTRNWGGVMKPISISAINLSKENVEFLEIWMRIDRAPNDGTGRMVIDLGSVSEDVIPNRQLNSEDLVLSSTPNGVLQDGEDVGLDMLSDDQERAKYASLTAIYPDLVNDPSGDNYAFDNRTVGTGSEDFNHINGSENNKDGPGGRIPDTEDLNQNGIVDLANSYFQYELSLDTVAARNPAIKGGGNKGWYLFRLPLRDYVRTVGSPTQENIEFIRVSFINATDTIAVRIADFNLVGSQWQKVQGPAGDSSFAISVVNIEENYPAYQSPPGVIRERDKTRPDEDVLANEQSLNIVLRGVPDGESRQVVRYYTYRPLDLFNYKTMKMFVHGDPSFQYTNENNYDAEIFFRFGLDSLNFYEYRAPLHPASASNAQYAGWDPLNDIVINFQDLTAIKLGRDSTNVLSKPIPVSGGPPGSAYRVLGSPSLTQVTYMAIGVENPRGKGTTSPLVGEVWANELRLISVDDTPGWAYRFDTQIKLADLGSVTFNYSRVDPFFHQLEQRFGSRQDATNWSLSASMQFERFLSEDWAGTQLGVSYSRSNAFVKPRYLPNSDIQVDRASSLASSRVLSNGGTQAQADSVANYLTLTSETHRVTETYAAPSFRVNFPVNAWYIRETFNKLSYGFTYTTASETSPSVVFRTSWAWGARMGYANTFSPENYIQPFRRILAGLWFLDEYKDFKLYYFPQSLNFNVAFNRSRDNSLQRVSGATEIISRNFTSTRGFGFGWKLTEGGLLSPSGDYAVSADATLLKLETDQYGVQRPWSEILNDIFGGDKLVYFGEDIRYSQRNSFNTKPNIPNILGIKRFVDFGLGYNVDYGWQNSLAKGDIGKSASFNANLTMSMNVRLKAIFDPLWEDSPTAAAPVPPRGRRGDETGTDSTAKVQPDTSGPGGMARSFQKLKTALKLVIKYPFLDYDNINVSFNQTNYSANSGVIGGTGFVNFWNFAQGNTPQNGPSRLYQLGLISDPSGSLTNMRFTSSPPFVAWDVEPGVRASGGFLNNTFRQTNRVGLKTSRGLWEGARLDLNWSLAWTYNRTQNLLADSITGIPLIMNQTTTGNLERSYLSFPDFLFFKFFNTSLEQVSKIYAGLKADPSDTRNDEEKLSQAFEQGLEAIPWLSKIFGQYYPRVNWSFRWDGLEKIPLFASVATRVSLDHAYNSSYTTAYQNRPGGGGQRTDAQRVSYGFTPLIGLNFTFKELGKGNLGGNARYNLTTAYDLATSSRNLIETYTNEVALTASYSRRGFEIPLFGLSLNNDIDISVTYSFARNSRKTYDVSKLDVSVVGTPLEGSTRTTLEPRLKYVLSMRVTASVYYKFVKTAPDNSGSRIPGITTNEAGLDVHISIQ
jgi:cell surface protein SprA